MRKKENIIIMELVEKIDRIEAILNDLFAEAGDIEELGYIGIPTDTIKKIERYLKHSIDVMGIS